MASHAFTIGGSQGAFLAFVVAAVVMIALFFALATLVAFAQERVTSTMRAQTHRIKRWGGGLLILVGGWLVLLAIWADLFAEIFPV